MRRILHLVLLVTLTASDSAEAISFAPMSLEQLYRHSAIVALVQITSAKLSSISYDDSRIRCGIIYQAEVRDAIKGEEEKVEFRSPQNLRVGGDYILFLSNNDLASSVRFMSMGRNDEDLYNKCMDIGPGLYASFWQGGIFEVYPILVRTTDGLQWVDWLKHHSDHLSIDPSLTQVQVELGAEGIADFYIEGELTNYGLYRKDDFLKWMNAIRAKLLGASANPAN